MNKILDLIFEDVKNENETKKTAVTLRISALIFIGYFLCLMAVFCSMGDWMNVGGCLVCGVCYVLSFYTTYLDHTRESAWISQILMIVWIILFIVMFGWDCGVQHYLFAFLALNFTVSTAGERRKVLNAVGACALRLALYAYARNFEPYSPLDPRHKCSDTDFKYHFYFCADHRYYDHIYEGCPENGTEACTV